MKNSTSQLTALALVVLFIAPSPGTATERRPNILWIVAEDLSPWMGCYGDSVNRGYTPTIDKLAQQGVLFKRAYTTAPVCSPARSALITGIMQTTTGTHHHRSSRTTDGEVVPEELRIYLRNGIKTLPELLRAHGYFTFNSGKDDYNFHYNRRALYDVGNAADYQPGMNGWQGNKAAHSKSYTQDVWGSRPDKNQPWFGQIQIDGGKGDKRYLPKSELSDHSKVELPPYFPDTPALREAWAVHFDNARGSDVRIASILKQLETDGELDNTIVIFFSDHGSNTSLRHKQFCYEGGMHVPLIIAGKHPAIKAGSVVNDLVSLLDVTATTLALAGVELPDYLDGQNLLGPNYKPREYVVGARDRCDYTIDRIRTIRTDKYRYIRNYYPDRPLMQPAYRDNEPASQDMRRLYQEGKLTEYQARHWFGIRPEEELYDLEADPHQVNNLATDSRFQTELLKHRRILEQWIERTGDQGQYPESPRQLKATYELWKDEPIFRNAKVNPEYDQFRYSGFCAGTNYLTKRPPYAGVWVNTFGKAYDFSPYHHFLAGEAGRLKWQKLQPGPNTYDFAEIEETLRRVKAAGHYYYCELWTGHFTAPAWLFTNGVPKVYDVNNQLYPYYLDEGYQTYLANFFKALATYLAGLPKDLRDRIAFLQPGFGSTGDRQLYKAALKDSRYHINSSQYVKFMRDTTLAWCAAFDAHPELAGIRCLWNIDDYDGRDPSRLNGVSDSKCGEMLHAAWMNTHFNCQLRKQQFTIAIGYMDVNEKNQDREQRDLFYGTSNPPRWGGNPEFVRGEHNDTKCAETPMARKALKWHYYWTAVSSVDKGLDAWETKPDYLLSGQYNEAYEFSHRYSFYKRPETSPSAFVALRDVLDYSDGNRFPSGEYGPVERKNLSRINAILARYAPYGATNEDSHAVMNLAGNQYLFDSKGLNDCVWNVIDRNYQRHMYQIHPNETSVGWWRVGSKDQPYGRFARAFQSSTGRNAMYFKFVDRFFTRQPEVVKVKVVYYDEFAGSTWQLRYDNGTASLANAATVTCVGDVRWKTKTVTLTNAVFAGNGPQGADLALVNTDSLDDKFHLVEVERGHDRAASTPAKDLMFGRDNDNHREGSSNIEAFSREGEPKDTSDPGHASWLSPESRRVLFTHSLP